MKQLTEKQQAILDFLEAFIRREGMAPTVYEIADYFRIKPATAFAHIRALQRKGYVDRSSKARSITLPGSPRPVQAALTISIPLVQKLIPGTPVPAEDNLEKTIQYDPTLLPRGTGGHHLFGLRITDDSMSEFGMMNGDIVIARQTETASIGDIVVVQVEREDISVRSLYIHDGRVELRPANSQCESRYYAPEEIRILGVVIALQRTFPG